MSEVETVLLADTVKSSLQKSEQMNEKIDKSYHPKPSDTKEENPSWYVDGNVDEYGYAEEYIKKHNIRCVNEKLISVNDPAIDEKILLREICQELRPYLKASSIVKKAKSIIDIIKILSYDDELPLQQDRIHCNNGTFYLETGKFAEEKEFCRNRLPVNYSSDVVEPTCWKKFLSDLLIPEDIKTLQEYMGYCLIPSTRAQKMLIIIGEGGEGKSRIRLVMKAILGSNMNTSSIRKIETSNFSRADLEGKLLMVDDDMDTTALPKTNNIKTIVTAEEKMDLERKGKQSYQGQLYARFLCLGNGILAALHDDSNGFYRRQIVLTAKKKLEDREDDPYLIDKLYEETEGIFLWCIEGLQRLINNKYVFTLSKQAEENVRCMKSRHGDSVDEFLHSEGYVEMNKDLSASTAGLYKAYVWWCKDNYERTLTEKQFSNYMAKNYEKYNLERSNNYVEHDGRCVRGYFGIGVNPNLGKQLETCDSK